MVRFDSKFIPKRSNAQYLASRELGEPLYTPNQVSRMIKKAVDGYYKNLPGKMAVQAKVRDGDFGLDISEMKGIDVDSANGDSKYQVKKSDLCKVVEEFDLPVDVDSLVDAANDLGFKI
jgi:hypothetical protein|tara:strand:+ start:276 stop:632 length:357 start_codon:yes stop_codon:yes gene_type:complete